MSDTREEARRVKAQVDELDAKVEVAAEAYNEARANHDALLASIKQNEAELSVATASINEITSRLETRARAMYRSGPLGFLSVLLGASDFEEFAATWDLLRAMSEQEAVDVAALKEARETARRAQSELAAQETEAKSVLDQMAAKKRSIEAQLAQRKSMLRGLENEVATLEAAARARAAAAARSSVSRLSSQGRSFPAPTRAPRSEVVNIAKRYLGAPYRWGAAGPDAFDCSGFTMFVYSQVGVSLPHSSRAQFGSGQRVSRSDLAPGDLVFFGSPIHHVGIYIGGGQYIHAPHTGDVVSIDSLSRGDYVGAVRP